MDSIETSIAYHEVEWQTAFDPTSPHHLLPDVGDADSILDIGCGAGQTMAALKTRTRFFVGIDIDFEALTLARRKTEPQPLDVARSVGEVLPFRDSSFSLVYCRVALPYMDIEAALAEIHRVLRPGGRVWLSLHTFGVPPDLFRRGSPIGKLYAMYVILNGAFFHLTGRTFSASPGRRESFQTRRGVRIALQRAGFTTPEIRINGRHFVVTAARIG